MGIENLNKKNPLYPGQLSKCYFHLSRSTYTYIVQVPLLIYGGSSTQRASRGSEAKRRPILQMLIQIAKLIFPREQPRIPNKLKQLTVSDFKILSMQI